MDLVERYEQLHSDEELNKVMGGIIVTYVPQEDLKRGVTLEELVPPFQRALKLTPEATRRFLGEYFPHLRAGKKLYGEKGKEDGKETQWVTMKFAK